MIHCRTASPEEVALLVDWAADEGWNPGLDDAIAFHAADPQGFLVACNDDDEPIAGISVIKQAAATSADPYGFLGLYICQPGFRGTGAGWQVWQAGMQYLEGHTVALDGVVEQQANYRKSGFEFAWRNIRYCGSSSVIARNDSKGSVDNADCRLAGRQDIAPLIALDENIGGVRREAYLSAWFSNTDTRQTLLAERKVPDGSIELLGCGTIRRCRSGHKIGPLLSLVPGVEHRLLKALVHRMDAIEIILDVPDLNTSGMAFAQDAGLKPVFETARMYRGDPPSARLDRVFGVATLELG